MVPWQIHTELARQHRAELLRDASELRLMRLAKAGRPPKWQRALMIISRLRLVASWGRAKPRRDTVVDVRTAPTALHAVATGTTDLLGIASCGCGTAV